MRVSCVYSGSGRLSHQGSPHQLLPSQLAVSAKAHLPGGVHHTHRQGTTLTHITAIQRNASHLLTMSFSCRPERINRRCPSTASQSLTNGRNTLRIIKPGTSSTTKVCVLCLLSLKETVSRNTTACFCGVFPRFGYQHKQRGKGIFLRHGETSNYVQIQRH